MTIREWPEQERPREKLLHHGSTALSDAELLAIFLHTGTPGITALDLARQLLGKYNGLRGLLSASQESFCLNPGLGPSKYAILQASLELSHRQLLETLQRKDAIKNPGDTRRYLRSRLREYKQEVFACLFLDTRHRVIRFEELFYGTIDGASVHPREVVKRALHLNASALILAHNHPSGIAEPSHADQAITLRLRDALALIDVRVLDHIIVGDGHEVSLAERGVI
ncbi:MAG: JAB domain-containing protein [Gammaproteobacteria bacterium]|nr:JAB domain-containing protein [Gammaproteobacteria bacterium]